MPRDMIAYSIVNLKTGSRCLLTFYSCRQLSTEWITMAYIPAKNKGVKCKRRAEMFRAQTGFMVVPPPSPRLPFPLRTPRAVFLAPQTIATSHLFIVFVLLLNMPPRVPSHRLSAPFTSQCCRSASQPVVEAHNQPTRQFHDTPRNATRLRRNMFAWLKGPGKAFRDPLPSSTNYLSAYDKSGNLLRARQENSPRRQRSESDEAELDEDEEDIQKRELESGASEEDVQKRAENRARRRQEKQELEARGGIPKERLGDLRPYPLNQQFRSQPVLSEELREKIYELVVLDRLDLKSVSATFGVDIRRVAAVVRLKSVEKQWMEQVSTNISLLPLKLS